MVDLLITRTEHGRRLRVARRTIYRTAIRMQMSKDLFDGPSEINTNEIARSQKTMLPFKSGK